MEDGQTLGMFLLHFSDHGFVQKQARSDAAGVVLGGKIYVVGGFDGANQLKSVERFNPRTGRWKKVGCLVIFRREEIISTLQVRDMGSPRSGVAAAAFNGSLFVVGGYDGNKTLRIGEVITDQHRLGEDHQH